MKTVVLQVFERMDMDADGMVTEEEFMNACLGIKPSKCTAV